MTTADDLRARLAARPVRRDTLGPFAWDPADADRLGRLRTARDEARGEADRHPKAATARSDATKAARAYTAALAGVVTVTFQVHAVGPVALEELMAEHPPTDSQIERERASAVSNGQDPDQIHSPFNDRTFPPALLAAACDHVTFSDRPEEPLDGLGVDEATTLWAGLPQGDQIVIHLGLMGMNQRGSLVEALGKD